MPSTIEFAAKRRKKKTRNCSKGYNCGNSCINKGLKCRRKFSNQASTYADWLKKNADKTVENSKNTRKKLTKLVDDATNNKSKSQMTARERLEQRRKEQETKRQGNRNNIPAYIRRGNNDLTESLDRKLSELNDLGIPAFTILETEGKVDKQTIFALNKKGEATVYRSKASPKYDGTPAQNYDWVESKYLHSNKSRKTLPKTTTNRFIPDDLDRVASNKAMQQMVANKTSAKKTAIAKENTRLKEVQAEQKAEQKRINNYGKYLDSAAKDISTRKGKALIAMRNSSDKEVDATFIGNGEFFVHGNRGNYAMTQTSSGLALATTKSIKDAKKIYAGITDAGEDWSKPITDAMKVKAGKVRGYVAFGDRNIRSVPIDYQNDSRDKKRSRNFSESSIAKGDTVTWKWGTGKANGKVLAIYHKSVTRKLKNSSITRNGSKDNPAYLIVRVLENADSEAGESPEVIDGSKILKLKSELL